MHDMCLWHEQVRPNYWHVIIETVNFCWKYIKYLNVIQITYPQTVCSPFWLSVRVIGRLNFIFLNLWVFTLWPEKNHTIPPLIKWSALVLHSEVYWNEYLPFLGSWIDCVPQCVVRVILEWNPRRRVPLGVLFTEALLGVRSQPKLLTFTELHQQDV